MLALIACINIGGSCDHVIQVPRALQMYSLDLSVKTGRKKLREEFQKNSHIRDPRVIDMLVIKVLSIGGDGDILTLLYMIYYRVRWN